MKHCLCTGVLSATRRSADIIRLVNNTCLSVHRVFLTFPFLKHKGLDLFALLIAVNVFLSAVVVFHIFSSLLVNIYGSCQMFVSEYRNMLADRLLQMCSYNISREVCLF